jgi:DNA-binding CsgD family transcriptional regulator
MGRARKRGAGGVHSGGTDTSPPASYDAGRRPGPAAVPHRHSPRVSGALAAPPVEKWFTLRGRLTSRDVGAQVDAALRAVAAGLTVRATLLASRNFDSLPEEPPVLLTPREIEVLGALGSGMTNKEVARLLGISPHTVKFHIESLFRKLGAASRAEAVAKGIRQQIVEF